MGESPVEDEEADFNDQEIDEDNEEDETIKETVSSSTSEKVEFSSEISSPESLSSPFPSSNPTNILKGENAEQRRNRILRRRLYSRHFGKKDSDPNSILNSTSTSASRSRFPASSFSSLSPSYT